MLYSIIPPILVVLSLVGIILILVRKAPEVSKIASEENFGSGSEIDLREPGFLGKSAKKIKEVNWKSGERVTLAVLEKMMKTLRFIFLKPGAIFSRWWVRIRNRRKINAVERIIKEKSKSADEDIINRIKNYVPEKKIVIKKAISRLRPEVREVSVEPMVSKEAVRPKTEMKDRLEELLMERIAANPKDIEAYERLGQYYMEIENYEFAKECFKQIVKFSPINRNAKYTLKKLERLLGK
ncbi:MAG TPA: tetratricopeptide repeat protein [Patescibacteria group bacterium]